MKVQKNPKMTKSLYEIGIGIEQCIDSNQHIFNRSTGNNQKLLELVQAAGTRTLQNIESLGIMLVLEGSSRDPQAARGLIALWLERLKADANTHDRLISQMALYDSRTLNHKVILIAKKMVGFIKGFKKVIAEAEVIFVVEDAQMRTQTAAK